MSAGPGEGLEAARATGPGPGGRPGEAGGLCLSLDASGHRGDQQEGPAGAGQGLAGGARVTAEGGGGAAGAGDGPSSLTVSL